MSKRLVLVDGMAILHRAYHAYPLSLTAPDGELTNAVYGFTTILMTVIEKLKPSHVVVAWDVGKPTFRHKEYEGYKAKREKPDDELIGQIGRTQEVVEVLNIPQFGVEGYEADDVVGTLSRQAIKDVESEVIIVTGDRDALQLVRDEKVRVWMPAAPSRQGQSRGPMLYDREAVVAKYGMRPEQLVDLKALMGDGSDDIPGIKGIGEKTASKLIIEFGGLDELYQVLRKDRSRVVELVGERFTRMLEEGEKDAYMSRKLGKIVLEVPVKLSWEKCKLSNYDRKRVVELFEKLAFRSLIDKLPNDEWDENLEGLFS